MVAKNGHCLISTKTLAHYLTGITHGIKRTPQWNHAAFANDLSIYVGTVRDGNKLLEVIHEFESWSGLRISIPKPVVTGAMYGSGTTRRQERVKADVAKRKRDAGPDILEPQIRAWRLWMRH